MDGKDVEMTKTEALPLSQYTVAWCCGSDKHTTRSTSVSKSIRGTINSWLLEATENADCWTDNWLLLLILSDPLLRNTDQQQKRIRRKPEPIICCSAEVFDGGRYGEYR